jgi:hypothetical protein
MSPNTEPNPSVTKRVVYSLPQLEEVRVDRDHAYRTTDKGALSLDVYYPPNAPAGARTPAVVFMTGYADPFARQIFGCALKDMGSYVSWAQLTAASEVVAITYTNQDPAADALAVLRYVRDNAAALSIDETRLGLWSCSGNVPVALSVLLQEKVLQPLRCAVLAYGYTMDQDGTDAIAEAARRFGFANPCARKSVDDLPRETPLFVARAGRDQTPGLNEAIDRFIAQCLARNLPLTVVNHAEGPHAFDVVDDSPASREVIQQILAFLRFNLLRARL